MFSGGTLTQIRLILGLKEQWLLQQYKDLNASTEDTYLKQNLEVKLKFYLSCYLNFIPFTWPKD